MVAWMARGFANLEFPSTYTMLQDSLYVLDALTCALFAGLANKPGVVQ